MKKYLSLLCIVLLTIVVNVSTANAKDVSGNIAENTIWQLTDSPITVSGTIIVAAGVTLTIEPGVEVVFARFTGMWVNGTLQAAGTSDAPVTFTGTTQSPEWWRALVIQNTGTAIFDWCTIQYAGYSEHAGILKTGSGSLTLQNSTISSISGDGLRMAAGYSNFTSANNTFSNNNCGVRLGINTSFDDNASEFSGNTIDVYVDGGIITGDTIWNVKPDYSLYISSSLTVDTDATLTVKPGTVVKFDQYDCIWVDGQLDATGTSAAPIYFTDWRDDAVGGDANRDADDSHAAPGWWRAIFVRNAGRAEMEWCTLRYPGYSEWVGMHKTGTGDLAMTDCTVTHVAGNGLAVAADTGNVALVRSIFSDNTNSGLYLSSCQTTATGCSFLNNTNYGILQEVNDSLIYNGNTFSGNLMGGVGVNGGTITKNITWQTAGSPYTVTGDITVADGAALTIEPGIKVAVNQFRAIWIDGTLQVAGTSDAPVTFTGTTQSPGWWRALIVQNSGSAIVDWCTIQYAGYNEHAGILKKGSGGLTLRNTSIKHIDGDGLRMAAGYSSFISADNAFSNNNYGVRLGINTSFDDNTSEFSGNTIDVYADGGTITGETIWNLKPDYSLYISSNLIVATDATLTVKPGTVVKFDQFDGIWVDGRLDATGTATAPIYFTDWRDDAVGGDANNDNADSAAAPGWWWGIFVQNAGSAVMEFCTVRYAGYNSRVGVQKTGSGDMDMIGCTIASIAGNGMIVADNTGTVDLFSSVFTTNTQSGLYISAGPVTTSDCSFIKNNHYGLLQEINDSLAYTGNSFTGNQAGGVGVNGGTMTQNITWQASGSPFRIIGNITVAEGATLTLEPGVKTVFNQFTGMFIDGTLQAAGTIDMPIIFTGANKTSGWWRILSVQNTGTATMEWCTIEYAGYNESAGILKTGSGGLTLYNSSIFNTTGDGLRIAAGYSSFSTGSNLFSRNNYGVRLGINTSFDDNSSDFSDNNVDVYMDGGTITREIIWHLKPQYSMYLSSGIIIAEEAKLTVKPGTVVKIDQFDGIWIDGRLDAVGTSAAPIYFTDWRDDTVGGDANGDEMDSEPATAWWRAVFVRNAGAADLEWCTLRYAGYNEWTGFQKSGTGDLNMTRCTISDIQGTGLTISGSTGMDTISRNTFTLNQTGVNIINQSETVVLDGNLIIDNSGPGVNNQNSAQVDARSNWWGDASGPYHKTSNPDGIGDTVSDGVLFDPWRLGSAVVEIISPVRSGTLVKGDSLRFRGSVADYSSVGYVWAFGDGRTVSDQNPGLIRFPNTGLYTVQLSAVINGQPDPYSDTRSLTIVEDTGLFPDLRVSSLIVPDTLSIGRTTTVSYTVQNSGNGGISGRSFTDALYYSEDKYLDSDDTRLATVSITDDIAAGGFYSESMAFVLPATEEGSHFLILSIDDNWQITETRRLNNEKKAAVNVAIPVLESDESHRCEYEAGRVEHYYRMTADSGSNLVLDFTNEQAGLSVYVRYGALPTRSEYDFRLAGDTLSIPAATEGTWYLLIYGDMAGAGQYSVAYSMKHIVLSGISPRRHGTTSDLDLTLTGAGFDIPMTVSLVAADDTVYPADTVEVDSFTRVTASFSEGTVPAGTYTARVSRNTASDEIVSAVEVIAGGQAKFETRLILPARFGYHQLATVYVEYENSGDASMPAPLLLVTATQNDQPGAIMTLDATRLSSGFWTSALPDGFSNSVQFLASGENPGILQPGESGRVPLYYAGWQKPWDFGYPPFEWAVNVLDAENETLVNWPALKDDLRPSYICADAWNIVWDNFTAQAGAAWGDYVGMLSRNANYIYRQGQRVDDIESLLALSFRKADGLCPLPVLAGARDVFIDAPGMPIVFDRIFAQPISRRFESGPLGFGWTHNWQYALTNKNDGTIVITNRTGTPRVFQTDSRYSGRYLAQPGDYGSLRTDGEDFVLTESTGMKFIYLGNGKLNYIEDPNANRITCTYSGDRLTGLSHSSGPSLTISYNGQGRINTISDYLGRQTQYVYSGEHLISCETYDGLVTSYTADTAPGSSALHGLIEINQPDGTGQFYSYDDKGRLSAAFGDNNDERIDFAYEDGGQVAVTDSLEHTCRFFFDHFGRLIKGKNPLGEVWQVIFDAMGNLASKIDPDGIRTSFNYDRKGNLVTGYDALRQMTRMTYTRNLNRLASVTDDLDRQLGYDFDEKGNLISVTYPDGSREIWTYDDTGNPTEWTNRRGNSVQSTYDEQGRLTGKHYSDNTSVSYVYDARGNLESTVDASGTTTFTYDENDYLIRMDCPGDRWLLLAYDEAGRRRYSEDQLGYRVNYHYDAAGRLSRLSTFDGDIVTYAYDASGRLQQKTSGNGVYTIYSYDSAGRLSRLENHRDNGAVLSFFDYTYDRRGRRTAMATHYGTWTFTYDDRGQLTGAVLSSTLPDIPDQNLLYTYDALGNRLEIKENGQIIACGVNNMNQYLTVGDKTCSYDADGNLIEETGPDGTVVYSYDDENRLIRIAKGADTSEYAYDALGNRTRVKENGTIRYYVVDPLGTGNIVGEYADSGDWLARYTYGLGLVNKTCPGGEIDFYTFDPIGSASELINADGVTVNAYAYQPFGKNIKNHQTVANPFRFAGESGVMADANGFAHMGARYYDCRNGRFTTMDPVGFGGGDINLYRYAMNDPVSNADPLGLNCTKNTGSAKRKFAASWTRYHDHINMRNAPRHPSGNLDDDAWVRQYFKKRTTLHRDTQDLAVNIVNDDMIVDSFWSWLPFYDWFSGRSTVKDVMDGVNDARNPGTSCRWNKGGTPIIPIPSTKGIKGTAGLAGSQDPNEKQTIAGYGEPNYVAGDTLVAYRIDFENTASASAPAQFVTVRDTISSSLDLTTMELLEVGFGNVMIPIPPGQQYVNTVVDYDYADDDYDFFIKVRVEVWIEDGKVWANFSSIDPETGEFELPPPVDIGFLMPENETGRGKGYISFAVTPKTGLASGTTVRNIATIQFDGSLKIDTNQIDPLDPSKGTDPAKEALVTFDTTPPTSSVASLPETVPATFTVSWFGADGTGAGIAGYNVYSKENSNSWTLWQSNTTQTSADFTGTPGNSYGFYCIATDNAGNMEKKSPQSEAGTTISLCGKKGDVNGDGEIDLADAVIAASVVAGIDTQNTEFCIEADINDDDRINLLDAIYILQYLAGLRSD